ncbi:endonuclease/exonuclease/phosphatase family protein [Sulfurospirillum sp. 1307]
MKKIFLLILPIFVFAIEFKVATYNVENLFDTKKNGHEYKEYIPNTKSQWNERVLSIKIKNISKVIKDINADIINLCEVENKDVLKILNLALGSKKYEYMYFKNSSNPTDCGLLSRFPIKHTKSYIVDKKFRPIHKVLVEIKGYSLTLFLNHWPSFKHGIKKRIEFAKKLKELYEKEKQFILLGDFNSPYEIKDDGWGKSVNYLFDTTQSLWFDIPKKDRYSYAFFSQKSAIDHIIISNDINYKEGSFRVFKADYLLTKYKTPKRWMISDKGKGKHLGVGYSDHFAIYATFSTKQYTKKFPKIVSIKELLKAKEARVDFILKDVMVVDKNRYGVFIEDKNRDKIFIYKPDINLEIGNIYTLHVKELSTYKGNKEIVLIRF